MTQPHEYFQLTLQHVLWRVEHLFHKQEIVTATSGDCHRYKYEDFSKRVRQVACFLGSKELSKGDIVGTLAWNTDRHLELYLATTVMGYVLHTLNVRFHPEQLSFVVRDAGDKHVFFDPDFESVMGKLESGLESHKLSEEFDDLIDSLQPQEEIPAVNEMDPAVICYTSGTTGHPKGVVYSHRSAFLHSMMLQNKDSLGVSSTEVILPVVPMFHISAWDVPFASLMAGAKLVLPGPRPQPDTLARLIEREKVTIAIGAPVVWTDFMQLIDEKKYDISSLNTIVTGGSEPPQSLVQRFQEKYGIRTYHAWGMTETEAISTVNQTADLDSISKQGAPVPGCEIDLFNEEGRRLAWDSKEVGELWITGAWITSCYFKGSANEDVFVRKDNKIWLKTGDIVTIDPNGHIKLVDRKRDLIRSGSEWISSIDLENSITLHPSVLEAAVVGVSDEKWGERPVAVVVPKKNLCSELKPEDIIAFLKELDKFPNWWLPTKVYLVDSIDRTSTGKFDKKLVRDKLQKKQITN